MSEERTPSRARKSKATRRRMEHQRDWADAVERRMGQLEMGRDDLAKAVGVSNETVRNWLTLRTSVDMTVVSEVADALHDSPLLYFARLGVFPDDVFLAGRRVFELEEKVKDLTQQLQESADAQLGPILTASVDHGRPVWVAPRREGVDPYRVHSVDVVGMGPAQQPEPDTDTKLLDRLGRLGGASQRPGSREAYDDSLPAEARSDSALGEQWSVWVVPRLNVQRMASDLRVRAPWRRIGITSTHLSSWATDVASLVALGLGYGSTNVNLLSRAFYGDRLRDAPDLRARINSQIAEQLVDGVGGESNLVWASASFGASEPLISRIRQRPVRSETLLVYLRPTDRLHEYIAQRPPRAAVPAEQLEDERNRFDDAFGRFTGPSLILDVGYPNNAAIGGPLTNTLRDEMLLRSMMLSKEILAFIADRTDDVEVLHKRFNQLADKTAPFSGYGRYLLDDWRGNCALQMTGRYG